MIKINDVINTIIQGDCLNVLKEIESNSVDLIFADPPYNMQTEGTLLRTNGSEFDGVSDNWDKFESLKEYDEFCIKWLSECKRILKNDGAIWVIGSFQNIYRLGYIMQDLGFWILNDVIWSKPNAVPNFGGTRFQNAHETLLWCSRSKKSKYCFNYKTMKSLNGSKQMKSVWDIGICIGNERLKDKDGKKVHSTQKPEKLLYNIIIATTSQGDIILDPFFGTGTTGAVAKRLHRNYIGIEREEYYIEHALKRINEVIPEMDGLWDNILDVKPPRVSIEQLIDVGFISLGEKLYDAKKSKFAVVVEDGKVEFEGNIDTIHHISGKMLNKENNNGWDYFWCDFEGRFVPINNLRYIYKERYER